MSDRWISLTLAERGLLESVARAILLYGPIVDDPQAVAQRIMALPQDYEFVREGWTRVRALLVPREDGRLADPEMDAALADASSRISQARENGKLGGRPRKPSSSDVKTGRFPSENRVAKLPLSDQRESTENPLNPPSSDRSALLAAFEQIAAEYPNCTDRDFACQLWLSYVDRGEITTEMVPEIKAGLQRWKDSELWARDDGKYIAGFGRWLRKKAWKDNPKASAQAQAAKKSLKSAGDEMPNWMREIA